ncbi:MAG: peptide ABC transporter substrate-binding protein [Cardiobacteriaceae bacterium]|nr:peptide ABC transporter substrate-binding protein [Cardiobacteriaceae bacterium]
MKKILLSSLILLALGAQAETTLRRANGAEPKSIDPQLASESAGTSIIFDNFEGLITRSATGELIGGVADKWEVSEDGKTYTFHLRDNAKWSDGTPVTASDFVYAWQRAVNPATGGEYAFILYPVKNAEAITAGNEKALNALGVKALDDKTLQIELNNPVPYFIELMSHYSAYPVPQKIVEQHGDKWTRPEHIVTNGPYHIVDWKPNNAIVSEKSANYWDKEHVSIDKVIYYPTESSSTAFARYRAGEVDYLESPSTEDFDLARKEYPNEVHVNPFLSTYWYGFNLTKPPFKDNLKLREALTIAIDRETLVKKVTKNGQIPAYSVVPPATSNSDPYLPPYAKLDRKAQIELARSLYAEAGYSKEKPLKVTISYNTNERHKQIAIAVAAMWKQVLGVQTELVNQEWKVLLANMRQKNFEVYRYAWTGDYNDPYTFLEIFQQNSNMNHSQFLNADFDAKLKEASKILDLKERAKKLHEAEQILTDDFAVLSLC